MQHHAWFWTRSFLCAALLTGAAAHGSGQGLAYLEGFLGDLSPSSHRPDSIYLNLGAPRLSVLKGMTEGVVLALRADSNMQNITIRVKEVSIVATGKRFHPEASPSPEKPIGCELFAVSHSARSTGRPGYLNSLIQRCPDLVRGNVAEVPEQLVYDLSAFRKDAPRYSPGDEPPLGATGPVRTGPVSTGHVSYFLLRYSVHPEAPPGLYDIRLAGMGAVPYLEDAGLTLLVINATLPPSRKHLSLSTEFDEQHHLRALADAGLTVMRVRSASQWPDRDERFRELASWGVKALSQHIPPQSKAEVAGLPATPVVYFYGVDEPQPKRGRAGREGWERMAEHIRKSNSIHAMGGKVGVSLPFQLAESLADRSGGAYEMTGALGTKGMYEPLDWSNYGSGLPRMLNPRDQRTRTMPGIGVTMDLHTYLDERRAGRQRKRDRLETCYFPLGLMRDPFYARYMFGVFAAESGLDGVFAWTAMRPKGNIFDDSDGVDALVALPTSTGIAATYCFEAMRAGINDLRIIEFLRTKKDDQVDALLAPWRIILVDGKPIDTVLGEAGLAKLRGDLMQRVLFHLEE